MESKYVVIKESDLIRLTNPEAKDECFAVRFIPAQKLWDAATKRHVVRNSHMALSTEPLYNSPNDFLTEQFDNQQKH